MSTPAQAGLGRPPLVLLVPAALAATLLVVPLVALVVDTPWSTVPDQLADPRVRDALWLTTLMVAVLVVPSLLVGLIVAMFQAATQINEQTLSFLPRLLVMLITLIVAGPWLVK